MDWSPWENGDNRIHGKVGGFLLTGKKMTAYSEKTGQKMTGYVPGERRRN